MDTRWLLAMCAAVMAVSVSSRPATATVLTYDVIGATNGSIVPQDYGDRITREADSQYQYGTAGGFTPNVVVTHGRAGAGVALWAYDFGDLHNVLYSYDLATPLEIRFEADPGYLVTLGSFDLAGWPNRDHIIAAIEVLDAAGQALFSLHDAPVGGDLVGPRRTQIVFAEPLADVALTIRIDSRNLGSSADDIGIDNIQFGQIALVPAPPSLVLLTLGVPALIAARCRRARRKD